MRRDESPDSLLIKALQDRIFYLEEENEKFIKYIKELELSSTHDQLTGLLNQKGLTEHILPILHSIRFKSHKNGHKRTDDSKEDLIFAYFDLDYFKSINDKFGRFVGDEVIIFFGNLLKEKLRETDMACRLSGDEFLAVFHSSDTDSVKRKIISIEHDLEQHYFDFYSKSDLRISASIGISSTSENVYELKTLIRTAEERMKENKGAKAR